jgi:hypothetical protein
MTRFFIGNNYADLGVADLGLLPGKDSNGRNLPSWTKGDACQGTRENQDESRNHYPPCDHPHITTVSHGFVLRCRQDSRPYPGA